MEPGEFIYLNAFSDTNPGPTQECFFNGRVSYEELVDALGEFE